jgi:hypothetical protein
MKEGAGGSFQKFAQTSLALLQVQQISQIHQYQNKGM